MKHLHIAVQQKDRGREKKASSYSTMWMHNKSFFFMHRGFTNDAGTYKEMRTRVFTADYHRRSACLSIFAWINEKQVCSAHAFPPPPRHLQQHSCLFRTEIYVSLVTRASHMSSKTQCWNVRGFCTLISVYLSRINVMQFVVCPAATGADGLIASIQKIICWKLASGVTSIYWLATMHGVQL